MQVYDAVLNSLIAVFIGMRRGVWGQNSHAGGTDLAPPYLLQRHYLILG